MQFKQIEAITIKILKDALTILRAKEEDYGKSVRTC
jgi:hypothetical protein